MWIEAEGKPDLRARVGETKALGHYADDLVRRPSHLQHVADDGAVAAETGSPHTFADDHDGWAIGLILGLGEGPPELWRDLEQRNQIRRYQGGSKSLRLGAAGRIGDVFGAILVRRDAVDGVGKALVGEVRGAHLVGARDSNRRKSMPGADQPIRVPVRQGPKEYAVHDREDGGAGADTDGERGNRRDGEDGRAAQ